MRALVYDHYGRLDVLEFRDMPTPTPLRGEVLVRVHAAALNPKDSFVRKGRFRVVSGRAFPKRVGVDMAGEVVSVASDVTSVCVGDAVYGMLQEWNYARGTLAQYVSILATEIARKPPSLSFEHAAALPLVSLTALQALRNVAHLREGETVCIHGASGGVGTVAIQIANALGAVVTTTSSESNRELCRSLGATETLDYEHDALFAQKAAYRVILDAFGNLSLPRVRNALQRGGMYVTTVPSLQIACDWMLTLFAQRKARLIVVRPVTRDLDFITGLVESGQLRPVIDTILPFDDVHEGVRKLESKRSRGKIVIKII